MRETYYELTDNQSKRLNIMKLLMALFVVYIHSGVSEIKFSDTVLTASFPNWFNYFTYFMSEVLPRCAVPGFFFMASFFLYRKSFTWKDNIIKKCKTLVVPYLILNSFWIAAYAIGQAIPATQVFFANQDNIVANFDWFRWLQAYGIGSHYPFLYPLWFVRNLFVLNILAVVIKKIIDFAPKVSFIVLAALFLFLPNFPFDNFCYNFYVVDFVMWCLGYYVVKYKVDINKFDKNIFVLIIFILLSTTKLILKDYNLPAMVLRITNLTAIVFWYSWFSYFVNGPVQKMFMKFSTFNFGIYIFHEMNLTFSKKLIAKLFGNPLWLLICEYIFLPWIIVSLVIVLCVILKKFTPKLFSILTGARVR